MAKAGAFALLLEGMMELLTAPIPKQMAFPTIGIGASANATYDGHILAREDMPELMG